MAVNIYYIVCSVIIEFIFLSETECIFSCIVAIVHWEVDDIKTTCLRIVWLMPCTIDHLGIFTLLVTKCFLTAECLRTDRTRTLWQYLTVPEALASIPLVHQRLIRLPCIKVARKISLTSIGCFVTTGTNLTIHKERSLVQSLILVLLTEGSKLRNELMVESES